MGTCNETKKKVGGNEKYGVVYDIQILKSKYAAYYSAIQG